MSQETCVPNPSAALAAACLSVGLATAWAPSAQGDMLTRVDVTSAAHLTIIHATLLLGGPGSGGEGIALRDITLPGGTASGSNLTWMHLSPLPRDAFGNGYAMIGLADTSGPYHVVVSTPGLTYMWGRSFESVFGMSEQQVIDGLLAGGNAGEMFLRTNFALLLQQQGSSSSLVSFSEGADFGSMNVTLGSVPTPGAAALIGIGIVAARRRRRA